MLKEVGCGSSTPPPGNGAVSNRQIGTGENNNADGSLGCGGCGREIAERWYLRAADRAWHCGCLRCCHCRVPLAAELTCFARDGNIYCKEDYYRLVRVVVRGLPSVQRGRPSRQRLRSFIHRGGSGSSFPAITERFFDAGSFRSWMDRESLKQIYARMKIGGVEFCRGRRTKDFFEIAILRGGLERDGDVGKRIIR